MSSCKFVVQYVLPVDNPVNNVSKRRVQGGWEFLVPINHPSAHNLGFQDLVAAAELSGLIHLSTPPKNKNSVHRMGTSRDWQLDLQRREAKGIAPLPNPAKKGS
jgi:hypothetical protein